MQNISNAVIVTNAVKALNEQRQAQVEATARGIIGNIMGENNNIKSYQTHIANAQKELAKITSSVITDVDALGGALPEQMNQNQVTIAKAIQQLNEANQASVKASAACILGSITQYEKSIEGCEQRIAKQREELAKLAVEVVDESIAG